MVRDSDFSSIGDYGLSLIFVNGTCGTATISCGETRTGSLTSPGQQNSYTFWTVAGDKVVVSTASNNYLVDTIAELYDPSGNLLGASTADGKSTVLTLPVVGKYTIVVRDNDFSSIGDYGLSLVFVNGKCGTAAISCFETKTGSLSSAGQQNSYTFPAVSGRKVILSTASTTYLVDTVAELYDPSGNLVGASAADGKSGILTIPTAGSYTIVVRDSDLSNIGDYGLSLAFVDGTCGTVISCGETKNGTLGSPGQQNSYIFPGSAGNKVVISSSSGYYLVDTVAELYDPSGSLLAATAPDGQSGQVTLPASGSYTILVRDSDLFNTGDYTLVFSCGDATCSYTLFPVSQTFPVSGGSGSVSVTAAPSDCAWTATSDSGWLTITSGASGTGNGSVAFSVSANSASGSRSGHLTIGGKTFTVTQEGTACTYSISPSSRSIDASGGTGSVAVTAGSNCAWTATSNAAWITITSGAGGTGNGTVSYTVAANDAATSRSGTMTIAEKTFTVTQAGKPVCVYYLSSSGQLFSASGGAGSVAVTAQTGCSWTASSNADWITITAGGSGSGNGTVNYSVAAHSGSASRSGALQIADQTYTVSQTGGQGITPGSSVNINVSQSQPVLVETVIPDGASNFFVLLQKDSSWWGTLEVLRDGKTLKSDIGSQDFALQMQSPAPGPCTIRVTGSGSGKLSILTSLPELKLGEWTIGSILRCYGSAWYEIHVPAGQQMLSVAAETLGLWSRLEVSYGMLGASPLWTAASGDTTNLQIQSPAAGTYYVSLTDSAWFPDHDIPRDHKIKADLKSIDAIPAADPTIISISPSSRREYRSSDDLGPWGRTQLFGGGLFGFGGR